MEMRSCYSGMDKTHLKETQHSPQAVQYGGSVSLGKGGERSVVIRVSADGGENIGGPPLPFCGSHGPQLSLFAED